MKSGMVIGGWIGFFLTLYLRGFDRAGVAFGYAFGITLVVLVLHFLGKEARNDH